PAYTNAAKGLIDGLRLDRNAGLAATFTGNLLDSLLRADAAHGAFETSVFSASTGDSNALIEFTTAVGSYELYTYQADRFGRFATEEQADQLSAIERSSAQRAIAQTYAELQVDPSTLQATTPAEIRRAFESALSNYPDYSKQAESRLNITASLIGQIADRAQDASNDAWWRAGLLLGLAVLGFVLWLAFSVAVGLSVVQPVQALTGAAQQVAEVAGRELARVADDDAEDAGPPRLHEVPVTVRDEIGELAEAFNHVQTTAAALLERQVLTRRNVAEMFGNVGRRVSNLTTRQLVLIDAVERGETDPALLERLYSIDHIAVRLRRNADSLMLLAGIRETVLDAGPTALTNVVRAALGQIEDFQRVQLHAGTETMVAPDIIGDLTLMIAELLENAVAFSPAGSPVEVTVNAAGPGAVIEIADHGLGLSAERLTEENARLIRRERLDVAPTRVLGLFVVGTLARRWEVGVELSRTPGGGVTATVEIPSTLLLTMSPVTVREPGRTAARPSAGGPVPSQALAAKGSTSAERPAAANEPPAADRPAALPAGEVLDVSPTGLPRRIPRREQEPAVRDTTARPEDRTGLGERRAGYDGTDAEVPSAPLDRPVPPDPTTLHDRAEDPPLVPRPRAEEPDPAARTGARETAPSPAQDPSGAARPLRRRVRGATLRTSGSDAAQQAARQAPRPADADEVRCALEEFEAAVERAHRDSATTRPVPHQHDRHDQNHLPEGAEQ
ncbi:MAG: HAMP domain-containing protein, partial [Kitasatospora sp.]|nr:HAMP domain-containing protein [Kitasatospora sp.]